MDSFKIFMMPLLKKCICLKDQRKWQAPLLTVGTKDAIDVKGTQAQGPDQCLLLLSSSCFSVSVEFYICWGEFQSMRLLLGQVLTTAQSETLFWGYQDFE